MQIGQGVDVSWDQLKTTIQHGLKTKCARITSANDLAIGHFKHVPMFGSQADTAELTALQGGSRPRKASQGGEDRFAVLGVKVVSAKGRGPKCSFTV